MVNTLKGTTLISVCFFLLLLIICKSFFKPINAGSQTITVLPGESIQEAIKNANAGDTIFVQSGIYYENVILNKSISLIGENSSTTFIDGSGESNVLNIVSSNIAVKDFTIQNGGDFPNPGSSVQISNGTVNVLICNNSIRRSAYGIRLYNANNSKILHNNITKNAYGIYFTESSSGNYVVGNTIANHSTGVSIATTTSKFNVIYHNNFINNTHQVEIFASTYWDDGYPSGGNYWSDYVGVDEKTGPEQDSVGSDGIGDTPYPDVSSNWDKYPLKGMITEFYAGTWGEEAYYVDVISNSKTSDFYFDPTVGTFIRFNVTGESGSNGFCRVTIPKNLLWVEDGWTIYVGGVQVMNYAIIPNENYTYMYFTYSHSIKNVEIRGTHAIPELSIYIFPLFMVVGLVLVVVTRILKNKKILE